jgi:hypothetical protein
MWVRSASCASITVADTGKPFRHLPSVMPAATHNTHGSPFTPMDPLNREP